ncbi:MAG: transporter substrate-binding domain-containing protein [Oceanospirillaceae bacterium]
MVTLWFMVGASAVAESDLNNSKAVARTIENLNWITEEYPPFNYRDPKTAEVTGMAVEVLLKIFAKLGVSKTKVNFKIYPWARGYHKVLNDAGTALFLTTYTMDRLQKMKFVGPVVPNVIAVIAPKSNQLSIQFAKDLNRLKIGVVREDIGEQLLISQGVKPGSIDRLNSGLSMMKKMAAGRIDAVAYSHATTQLLFKTANINPNEYEIIYVLKNSTMGFAFHNSTDASVLEAIRKALYELTVDGTLSDIQVKYGLKSANE